MAEKKREIKTVATNRKARYEYEILDQLEAGIALLGSEVKVLREGKANIQDCHARIEKSEVILYHFHIPEYKQANYNNHDEYRPKKLLLHRQQIRKLERQVVDKGMTLIPLSVYFNEKNCVKINLAVARGKKLFDKRESIAKKDRVRTEQREHKIHG